MDELELFSEQTFKEGTAYLKTLEKKVRGESKFNNNLLYGIILMCCEKLFVAHISKFGFMASHHTADALYEEAKSFDEKLPDSFEDVVKKIGEYESICSMDGFGYKTPEDNDIIEMINGLTKVAEYVGKNNK